VAALNIGCLILFAHQERIICTSTDLNHLSASLALSRRKAFHVLSESSLQFLKCKFEFVLEKEKAMVTISEK
jgi:hypothetical protein